MAHYQWSRKVFNVFVLGGTTFAYNGNGELTVGAVLDPLGGALAVERVMVDMSISMSTPVQVPAPPDPWAENTGWQMAANISDSNVAVPLSPRNSAGNATLVTGALEVTSITHGPASGVIFARWATQRAAVSEAARNSPTLGVDPSVHIALRGEQPDGVGSALAGYTFTAWLWCYARVLFRYV